MPDDQPIPADPALPAPEPALAEPSQPIADGDNPDTPKEQAPMLDVHAPHHAVTTWRDFFIHMTTIVLGLLIAIGLEQTVEALHRQREGAELRETLHRESQQIVKDSNDTVVAINYHVQWLTEREEQVKDVVWQHKPLAPPANYALPVFFYPDNPLWRSAKLSGLAARLSQPEVNAYSEVELLSTKLDAAYAAWQNATGKRIQFEKQFPNQAGAPDFTKASTPDMRTYLDLLSSELGASIALQHWVKDLLGAEDAILKGNLQLDMIFASERAFDPPPKSNP
jgi:hypothetical protein